MLASCFKCSWHLIFLSLLTYMPFLPEFPGVLLSVISETVQSFIRDWVSQLYGHHLHVLSSSFKHSPLNCSLWLVSPFPLSIVGAYLWYDACMAYFKFEGVFFSKVTISEASINFRLMVLVLYSCTESFFISIVTGDKWRFVAS